VAYGRPKVTLTPSASLAAIAAQQASVQDQADHYRAYPVLKIGLSYGF
jgi:hypothetical protein